MAAIEGSELHGEIDGCSVGTLNKCVVVVWSRQATVPAVEKLNQISKLMAERHPTGFSALHYVVRGAPLPEPPARKALSTSVHEFQNALLSAAVVVEGTGFWTSALRSFVTGLSMFSKVKDGIRVFAEARAAVDWLAETQQESPRFADRLFELLQQLLPAASAEA